MLHIFVTIFTCLGVSLALLVLDKIHFLFFSLFIVIGYSIWISKLRLILLFFIWMMVFILPLFVIHCFLNPMFETSDVMYGIIPWKPSGFIYATEISTFFLAICVVAVLVLNTSRNQFIDFLLKLKTPIWIFLPISQSISMSKMVEQSSIRVFLAQRARGVNVGPKITKRVTAVIKLVIPTVVGILLDADARVEALKTRGLSSDAFSYKPIISLDLNDWIQMIFVCFGFFILWWLQ